MKTKIPTGLQASDFQRWLVRTQGYSLDEAIEFCRDGDPKLYVVLFNEWQNAKREKEAFAL